MKIKSLLIACCFGLMGNAIADNRHYFPGHDSAPVEAAAAQTDLKATAAGWCEVEIINQSYDNVTVYATLDNGAAVAPFDIYSWEAPHYVDLAYRGYCNSRAYLDIVTFSGYHVFSGYAYGGATVRLVPYLNKQVKAEIKSK